MYIYIHIPMRFPSYSHLMVFFHEIPIFDGSNPMESHGFFRVSPRPIRKWSSRKALRCRLPFRGQQKPWQICGKWEILWDEIWETMGKYGKTYIYIYIDFNVQYWFWFHVFSFCFFRMVHGFPIFIPYIYNMPHVDDLLSESDMNGYSSGNRCRWFLSVFFGHTQMSCDSLWDLWVSKWEIETIKIGI